MSNVEKMPSGRIRCKSAVRVTCRTIVRTPDNDLIVPGTPGTLLRWAQEEDLEERLFADDGSQVASKDTTQVVVAFDAYMFVDSGQCNSRHCRENGGIEAIVDSTNLQYLGSCEYIEGVDGVGSEIRRADGAM